MVLVGFGEKQATHTHTHTHTHTTNKEFGVSKKLQFNIVLEDMYA